MSNAQEVESGIPTVMAWEYSVQKFQIDEERGGLSSVEASLAVAGADGWELVSVIRAANHVSYKIAGGRYTSTDTHEHGIEVATRVVLFMKRPAPTPSA